MRHLPSERLTGSENSHPCSARGMPASKGVVLDATHPLDTAQRLLHTQAQTVGELTHSGKPLRCVSVLDSGGRSELGLKACNALSCVLRRRCRFDHIGATECSIKPGDRGFVAPKLVQVAKSTFERVLQNVFRVAGLRLAAPEIPRRPPVCRSARIAVGFGSASRRVVTSSVDMVAMCRASRRMGRGQWASPMPRPASSGIASLASLPEGPRQTPCDELVHFSSQSPIVAPADQSSQRRTEFLIALRLQKLKHADSHRIVLELRNVP